MTTLPTQPEGVADKVVDALDRIARALRAHRQAIATGAGLTPLQLDLLRTLGHAPPPRPTPGELAVELGVRQPTITDSIIALERKGHVTRHLDPADRRRLAVRVTPSGQALLDEAEHADRVLATTIAALGSAEQERLLGGLLTSISGLLDAGAIQVARTCTTCHHFNRISATEARCGLLQAVLGPADLRVNCAEHEPRLANSGDRE